ncbi:hypothetical protein [Phaffia rhodozyma]|uniref:Secreted protein n=1 Tax=Phaffia rhodozyma TaxID=264483 RepID=A0A0F7SU82_PHARH|nr:hypothetical protein [Phaffia rhodozyma]
MPPPDFFLCVFVSSCLCALDLPLQLLTDQMPALCWPTDDHCMLIGPGEKERNGFLLIYLFISRFPCPSPFCCALDLFSLPLVFTLYSCLGSSSS